MEPLKQKQMKKQVIDTSKKFTCKSGAYVPEVFKKEDGLLFGLVEDLMGNGDNRFIPTIWYEDGENKYNRSYDLVQEPEEIVFDSCFLYSIGEVKLYSVMYGRALAVNPDYRVEVIEEQGQQHLKFYKKWEKEKTPCCYTLPSFLSLW